MSKINLLVLFGGESEEHDVSNISAYNILSEIDKEKYNIITVGITRDGKWYLVGDYTKNLENIRTGNWQKYAKTEAVISPSKLDGGLILLKDNKFEKIDVDVCFPVLHGSNGEDGTIQALLKLAGIRRVGAGFCASAVAMHKKIAKILLENAGIPIVPSIYADKSDNLLEISEKIELPCFVKPSNSGSSVGAAAVFSKKQLIPAIEAALKIDSCALIEKYIDCREIECAVLGTADDPIVSKPGEISSTSEFYDYDTKYVNTDSVKLDIPADISEKDAEKIMSYAKKAYKTLELSGMARCDFFIDKKTNEIYLNEINTIPGFTKLSMYPLLMKNTGLTYSEIIDKLIELSELN